MDVKESRARFTASRHVNLCILLIQRKLLYSHIQSCPRLCRSTAIDHRQTIVAALAYTFWLTVNPLWRPEVSPRKRRRNARHRVGDESRTAYWDSLIAPPPADVVRAGPLMHGQHRDYSQSRHKKSQYDAAGQLLVALQAGRHMIPYNAAGCPNAFSRWHLSRPAKHASATAHRRVRLIGKHGTTRQRCMLVTIQG